jgi:beta-glucosidase
VYEDTACYGNFGFDSQVSKRVEYVEGVFVGYRHFDRHWNTDKQALYPFGFGLSYTTFGVTDASLEGAVWDSDAQTTTVSVSVANTGDRAGAEVIQVYICPPAIEGLERPVKELASYAKVVLNPQEEKVVKVDFGRDAAAYWDEAVNKWRVVPGQYTVLVATSSAPDDVKSRLSFEISEGLTFDP